jgi:hypothetical protein
MIRDNAFADQGTLNSWSLEITSGEAFRTTDADGNYSFADLPPGQYLIREEAQPGWAQVPPSDADIPAATFAGGAWTVGVVGVDNPSDPDGPDARRNVKNVSFGNRQTFLPGDFNRDDVVDSADYILYRKTLGTSVPALTGADGDGDGVVDADDLIVWRANFGQSNAAAAGSGQAFDAPPIMAAGAAAPALAASPAAEPASSTAGAAKASPSSNGSAGGSALGAFSANASSGNLNRNQRPLTRGSALGRASKADITLLATLHAAPNRDSASDNPFTAHRSDSTDDVDVDCVDAVFELLSVGV